MYNGPGPVVIGTGIVGGVLAKTGFDGLLWAALALVLITVGLVCIRLSSVAHAKRH